MDNSIKKAPIAFFAYRRPAHALKSLESLSRCEGANESELFIYCDGAKGEKDRKDVEDTRRAVKSKRWCGKVHVIERDKNMGLAESIIMGVTELVNKYGRVIVLEDDLVLSRYFLDYMNFALDRYREEEKVMQISGHMLPIRFKAASDAVFLPTTTSWGWATWQRAWAHFDKDMKGYNALKNDAASRKRFDLDGAYPYFDMLEAQKEGRVDSWAIRWHLGVFMKNGLTLFPRGTLIQNIGFDGSGTHGGGSDKMLSEEQRDFHVVEFPGEIEISKDAFTEWKRFLRMNRGRFLGRVMGALKRFVKHV